ncbi:MAG TPA: protein kinase, partial [Kofleriaceae bacterium]|nr:protein kinase [Kofleriaceae bacterium]
MSGSNSNEREQRSAGRGDRGRDRGGGGAPLDETLEAHTGSAASPGALSPPEPDLPPLDSEGRRRAIESPERDHMELVEVDPDHYVAGCEVARGGMGRIVAARDRRLGRVVAIKELIQNTAERAARLEREALITARLQHPAIVNLHEAGRWPSGQPFYSMKLVAGRSLAQVVSEPRPLAERLALLPNLIAMAEAVAYAHRHHIIHRDLKPSNVLIGELGETVVIDWGLAKDLAAEPGDRTHLPGAIDSTMDARAGAALRPAAPPGLRDGGGVPRRRGSSSGGSTASLTIAGSIMGTPGYMPPEQAAGKDVDERADVFALGAILYHVLGGVEPYRGASSEAVLAAVLAGPPAPLERVEPGLAQDLVTIVEKAMAALPDARYPTAFQLVEDLRRFQTGKLVGAHRYSRRELFWRFLVRQRAAVVAGLAALAAIAVIALVSFQRVVAERDRAAAAGVAAERRADELTVAQAGSLLEGDPRAALDLLARLSPGATSPIWRSARMVASDARLRGIPDLLRGHQSAIADLDLSADGKLMVSADLHEVRVWDLTRGQSRVLGRQDSPVQNLVLAPDARHAVSSGLDGRLRLWTLDGGGVTEIGGHDALVTSMHFLPDGERLVSAGGDGAVRLWRVGGRGGELIGSHQGRVFDLDVSHDGGTLASVGEDNVVRIWHPGQRGPVRELRASGGSLDRVALSPDGTRVAAVGSPRDVWLWQVATGEGKQLAGHDKEVLAVAFSPDGSRLATAGRDRTVRLWDVASGGSEVLRDHDDDVTLVQFAGAELLVSSAHDGTVRVWMVDGTSASAVQVLGGHDREKAMDVSDDGSAIVTSTGTLLRRWQIGAQGRALRGHRGAATQVEVTPDGRIVSGSADWTLRVWPARAGEPRVLHGHEAGITGLAVSLDGRFAASIDAHRLAWLWDLTRGTGR